jgi:two-component system CheB/CheR fusion protein
VAEDETPAEFEELLEHVRRSRGFDFTGYKRASLRRRIDKRLRSLDIDSYEAYLDHLETHPGEFTVLFNTILINVTSFFRDATTWTYLTEQVLPAQLERLGDRPIRVWSAGCSSGEEAYTLAIVLAELLGTDEFKRRVKIYGTDIDDDALTTARSAAYDERQTASLPGPLRDKYFETVGDRYVFRNDLRRSVIFGRLDILHDAPISRLELLTCRNTLMYFNAETQQQVIERFHFALNDRAVMMLGKAETLLSHSSLFDALDRKRRIFAKVRGTGRERLDRLALPTDVEWPSRATLHATALAAAPTAAILVDSDGYLADSNDMARQTFGVATRDHGLPIQDLEISYRPAELRAPLAQAYNERRPVTIPDVS